MKQSELLNRLKAFEHKEVFFGPQGFSVITKTAVLKKAQIGYAIDKKGASLVNSDVGNWQSSWFVISTDTELGDPYFIDFNDEHLAVYTAVAEEENQWQTTLVSASLDGFEKCLTAIYQQCEQKSAMYLPDDNCIFDLQVLESFGKQLVEFSQTNDFWQYFFIGYVDWLRDEHV